MSYYDLLDHQKQFLRELAAAYREAGSGQFYCVYTMGSPKGIMIASNPRREAEASTDDLLLLEREGLVTLRLGTKGIAGGQICNSALVATENDFRRPVVPTQMGTVQQFYAPVGAVHSGAGNISIQTQNVSVPMEQIAEAIAAIDAAIEKLPPAGRAEALEAVSELKEELAAKIPKQSRIKAFLLGTWAATKDVAEVGANLAQIAQAYGIDGAPFGA